MLKKILTVLIVVGVNGGLFAQGPNLANPSENIILPSPEAADLGKYGDIQLNYNLGTSNISIPLHRIEGKSLTHIIAATYDATGNKVSTVASNIGLGWTLQAGGVITRTIRGERDDIPKVGYFDAYKEWIEEHLPLFENGDVDPNDDSSPSNLFAAKAASGEYDLTPDIFYFNFDGYQGRILFNEDREPLQIPHQDLKIEYDDENWVITAPNGVQYYFLANDAETTDSNGPSGIFKSAWYLSEIVDAHDSESIRFQYSDFQTTGSVKTRFAVQHAKLQNTCMSDGETCYPINLPVTHDEIDSYQKKYLTAILLKDNLTEDTKQLVSFGISVGDRLDQKTTFTGPLTELYSISVKDKLLERDLKNLLFEYDYFGDNCQAIPGECRLKLEEIKFYDGAWQALHPPYEFSYTAGSMPDYESYSKDHWGYDNDRINQGLIPTSALDHLNLSCYAGTSIASANRTASTGSLNCLLEEIKYPTGGKTEFEYAVHNHRKYIPCPVTHVESLTAYGNNGDHDTMSVLESSIRAKFGDGDSELPGGKPNVRALSINIVNTQSINVNISKSTDTSEPGDSELELGWPTSVLLIPTTVGIPEPADMGLYALSPGWRTIHAGDYHFVVMIGEDYNDHWINASFSHEGTPNSCLQNEWIGGAKLERIVNKDNEQTITSKSLYYAENFVLSFNDLSTVPLSDDGGFEDENAEQVTWLSPDQIVSEIKNLATSSKKHYNPYYVKSERCREVFLTAYDTQPFSKNEGHHIGYSEVTELNGSVVNGVIVYHYINGNNSTMRGKLIAKEYYRFDQASFDLVLIRRESHEYDEFLYVESIPFAKIDFADVRYEGEIDDLEDLSYTFDWQQKSYASFIAPITAESIQTVEHDALGNSNTQTLETEYFYDFAEEEQYSIVNTKLSNLTRIVTHDRSSGQSTYEILLYPHSFVNGARAWRSNHITNQPLAKIVGKLNGSACSQTFGEIHVPSSTLRTAVGEIYRFEPLSEQQSVNFEYRVDYEIDDFKTDSNYSLYELFDYHNKSLIFRQGRNGQKEVYIWGYKNHYPIAVVRNATATDIPSEILGSVESHDFSESTINETEDMNALLLPLRQKNYLMVDSFIYDPFRGISSKTDANGITQYFNYDGAGRLLEIKDNNLNLFRSIEYKFRP